MHVRGLVASLFCCDVVSAIADQHGGDSERRVRSGPKERTHSSDRQQTGLSLSADRRSVYTTVSFLPCDSLTACNATHDITIAVLSVHPSVCQMRAL